MSDQFVVVDVPDGGVRVGDIKEEVLDSVVCQYFGPKSSKSGWKYNVRTTLEEQDAILSFYWKVYETKEMPNKELTLQFARGNIVQLLGKKVDWLQFQDERRVTWEGYQKKRKINLKERAVKEGERVFGPTTIGKRRCSAPLEESGGEFPSDLKLIVMS